MGKITITEEEVEVVGAERLPRHRVLVVGVEVLPRHRHWQWQLPQIPNFSSRICIGSPCVCGSLYFSLLFLISNSLHSTSATTATPLPQYFAVKQEKKR